jgi:hypothetical protein
VHYNTKKDQEDFMSETEELFTKDHNRLLSIAGWANALAWAALVFYLFLAVVTIVVDQSNYQRLQSLSYTQYGVDYWEMARSNLLTYVIRIGSDILSRVLAGFVYFVVLKGISLGLYMVIETDMNYRHKENDGGNG